MNISIGKGVPSLTPTQSCCSATKPSSSGTENAALSQQAITCVHEVLLYVVRIALASAATSHAFFGSLSDSAARAADPAVQATRVKTPASSAGVADGNALKMLASVDGLWLHAGCASRNASDKPPMSSDESSFKIDLTLKAGIGVLAIAFN